MNDTRAEQLEESPRREAAGSKLRFGRPLPAEPTGAVPGSEEKIKVLQGRVARGEQLYHPLDATREDPEDEEKEAYPFVKANRRYGRRRKPQKPGYNKFSTELAVDEE